MLNFFTTSNGFRSTLPVVSNLTAMNLWDGVCMCFIYASLLEFVCVNYVGRKRPLHNVVYRPGENPVTQVGEIQFLFFLGFFFVPYFSTKPGLRFINVLDIVPFSVLITAFIRAGTQIIWMSLFSNHRTSICIIRLWTLSLWCIRLLWPAVRSSATNENLKNNFICCAVIVTLLIINNVFRRNGRFPK